MINKIKQILGKDQTLREHELAPHLRTGTAAEHLAREHLEKKGLITVATNESSRFGELDIIMLDKKEMGDTLVFVEVRFRANTNHGSALESINRKKQNKIIKAAKYFLKEHREFSRHFCRFDVVTIESSENNLQWTPSAFTLEGYRDDF